MPRIEHCNTVVRLTGAEMGANRPRAVRLAPKNRTFPPGMAPNRHNLLVSARAPRFIATSYGAGYRWIAALEAGPGGDVYVAIKTRAPGAG